MTTRRISIFPLTGAVLYPGLQLPLHIFEPRYRQMVADALHATLEDGIGAKFTTDLAKAPIAVPVLVHRGA